MGGETKVELDIKAASPRLEVPLIVNHEIINLPSASVLAELRRQEIGRGKPPQTVAILADPVFDPRDERLKKRTLQEASSSASLSLPGSNLTRSAEDIGLTRGGKLYLSRLVYTRNEADAVMAVMPPGQGTLALDFEASRRMAINPALAKYHIVHFATANSGNPCRNCWERPSDCSNKRTLET